jgi:oligopeptide transport system permease protein
MKHSRLAKYSLIFLVLILLAAVLAPWITPFSYDEQNILEKLQGSSFKHWMGTDLLGRDIFSRILYGARMSMAVGICTAIFSLSLGTLVGSLAGYWGGWIDAILMHSVDILAIFPSPLLAILLSLVLGRGVVGIMIAIGISSWTSQARLVRGQVMQTREMAYIEAAHSLGISVPRLIWRHILPNCLGPILVSVTHQIPLNMMTESFLSFIGLGLQPPYSSWGTLTQEGFRAIQSYPHLIIYPGAILFFTLLAFHYVGDGLQTLLGLDRDHQKF